MKYAKAVFCILLAFLLFAAPAIAQSQKRRPPTKDGFLIGFSAGFGSTFPCDECPSLSGSFTIGAMAMPDLAIVADFGAVGGDDEGFDEPGSLGVGAIAVQYWPDERFWVKAGVGVGSTFSANGDADWDNHHHNGKRQWAAIAAAGFDIVQLGTFVMDVQVRSAFVSDHQSVAVGIGFNWY